ncbi:MAG: histidinol-phosphatase [Bacteroidales bacterium]|jgi:histidinol-phosphatase (PHP family)|nr:histidinol-phosphatase [Bacteroidales bacterium]
MKANFHTHSTYCDGKDPQALFVAKAKELGFARLGFSSHAPVPGENDFAIDEVQIPDYLKNIDILQSQNPDIELFKSLECDFIPDMTRPFQYYTDQYKLDYIIGGVHLVRPSRHSDQLWFIDGSNREIYDAGLQNLFHNDIRKAVTVFWEQTCEMIETQKFNIIAHLDKIKMHNQRRFFNQSEKWYLELVDHTLSLIKAHDIIVEINTRGFYKGRCDEFYPSDCILEKMGKMGIRSLVSSDAHQSEELDLFYDEALNRLRQFGVEVAEEFPF